MTIDDLRAKAAKVKLIALDNDGVLTDGRVYYDANNNEMKSFDIRDGFGIIMARRAGLKFIVITGKKSPIIDRRAEALGIEEVYQAFTDKAQVLHKVLIERGLDFEEAAFMGDDLFDLPVMRMTGLGAAPADAHPDVLEGADWVSKYDGGRGAVREFVEFVVKARGNWSEMMNIFSPVIDSEEL